MAARTPRGRDVWTSPRCRAAVLAVHLDHGLQHNAYVNCMSPAAVSHTQRSNAVKEAGELGNALAPVDARFSDSVAPATASQLPLTGLLPAGQTC